MKLNYWNASRLTGIAWDALEYHIEGVDFRVTADAALSLEEETEGIGFCSARDRDHAVEKIAYYLESYLPAWQSGWQG